MPDAATLLTRDLVEKAYGPTIDLGACLISPNLNLFALRGSTPLDRIAIVSAPDVVDPVANPGGTQRPLDKTRSTALLTYALGTDLADDEPRALPEVLLNVRDTSVIQIYDLADGRILDFNSWQGLRGNDAVAVGARIPLQFLQFPKPEVQPQISRFDGNHRLSGMDSAVLPYVGQGEEYPDAPSVTFSLYVGLNTDEERRLFNVVNSKQKPVEPALLETQNYGLLGDDAKTSAANLPSHLAHELSQDNGAFAGIVFLGGSKVGSKAKGISYTLKINTLRSTMNTQLKSLKTGLKSKLTGDPALLVTLVNNYWLAIRHVFPEAWADKEHYILMQTIGLTALANLWGETIVERALKEGPSKGKSYTDYVPYLQPLRDQRLLRKDLAIDGHQVYAGLAGIAGADKVLERLTNALTDLDILIAQAKAVHTPEVPLDQQLDA